MGLIHIALFATLDLVGQGPGGPCGLTSMGVGIVRFRRDYL